VFVIQLEGTKSWQVWPAPEHRRGDDAGNLNESTLGEPAVETTLKPGDVQTGVEVSHHLRDAAAADAIGPDRPLARAESISVLERGDNGKVKASVNGAVHTLPANVIEAVNGLSEGGTVHAGALLPGVSTDLSTRTARTPRPDRGAADGLVNPATAARTRPRSAGLQDVGRGERDRHAAEKHPQCGVGRWGWRRAPR
jgi:hypothetical protein